VHANKASRNKREETEIKKVFSFTASLRRRNNNILEM
jgi:hypothetical protein